MEDIDDTDARLLYHRLRDKRQNEKDEKELEKEKKRKRWQYFIAWFLDVRKIKF